MNEMTTSCSEAGDGGNNGIESLPDSLLTEILSLMPARKAFDTRLLSRRWRYLWAYAPKLDFSASSNSLGFIHKMLSLYKGEVIESISFAVYYSPQLSSKLDSCIQLATKRKVKELRLALGRKPEGQELYLLPYSVISCDTLTMLELEGCIYLSHCSKFRFGSLKKLVLRSVSINGAIISNLLAWCPLLETLELLHSVLSGDLRILDSRGHLRSLLLDSDSQSRDNKIEIESARIESLVIKGYFPRNGIRVKAESSLITVNLDFGITRSSEVRSHGMLMQLLFDVCHAKDVALCSGCLEVLSLWGKNCISRSSSTSSKLTVRAKLFKLSVRGMARLLEIFREVECLNVLIDTSDTSDTTLRARVMVNGANAEGGGEGDALSLEELLLPSALQHLKTINIFHLSGDSCMKRKGQPSFEIDQFLKNQQEEIGLIKFLLRNSMALETMNINVGTACTGRRKRKLKSCMSRMLDALDIASPIAKIKLN